MNITVVVMIIIRVSETKHSIFNFFEIKQYHEGKSF